VLSKWFNFPEFEQLILRRYNAFFIFCWWISVGFGFESAGTELGFCLFMIELEMYVFF
jgi:hypothetical protein